MLRKVFCGLSLKLWSILCESPVEIPKIKSQNNPKQPKHTNEILAILSLSPSFSGFLPVLSRHDALHFNGISKFVDASVFMLIDSLTHPLELTRILWTFMRLFMLLLYFMNYLNCLRLFMLLYLMMIKPKPKRRAPKIGS
jgi:hypothetical protein